ncbi:hypothetical protein ACFXO7_34515, partial [Nocardia tengchongensis]|uniref:hypothetical protein n=1 Tax=Nocardia tengchongensis TaxID=2055889 RepID=UPI0036B26E50
DTPAPALDEPQLFGPGPTDLAARPIAHGAGAAPPPPEKARQRLLASSQHLQTKTAFGALPDIVAQSAADLIGKLDEIDRDPDDKRT